ncbi:BTAD domain-containing putative transcriptional regulator [Plantactinospora sp. GCM10030261]|uniref:AfsR/SARP family transcriptional regulator n=1 Tax=Plantactinospora sp. GCM10030261 TaxID=3273420 RepID=UPI0036242F2B
MLEILLLGPTEAIASGLTICLSPLQRNVLAVLSLSHGTVVSTNRLIDSLWGDHPPAAPRSRVQGLISELRRKIGVSLTTKHPGYLLDPDTSDTDVRKLYESMRRARQATEAAVAAVELRAALALWRGDPLDGVTAPGVEVDRTRLTELRVGLLEDRFGAELDLGQHAELVAELTAAVAAHPLRERLAGQLMRALYRCGRQTDALRVYQSLRERLVEEVGGEPCAALRQLHTAILRGEPGPGPRPAMIASTTTARGSASTPVAGPGEVTSLDGATDPRPAQLPGGVGHFTGRTTELAALTHAVAGGTDEPRVLLVSGLGGLGKTALAVHWARTAAGRYLDGQIFVDLHGHDAARALTGLTALGAVLTALGVPRRDLPDDLDGRTALYRTLANDRRLLLVADDAATTAQILPLVPPTTASQLVVTSRLRLPTLARHHAVHRLPLEPLPHDAARDLLVRMVGPDRLRDQATCRVLHWCGGHPVALRLVGARLAVRPGQSVASFADELGEPADDLLFDELPDLHAALVDAYRSLSPAAAHLFGRLGLEPGQSLCVHPVAMAKGAAPRRIRRLLDELLAVNLVAESGPDCYRCPDLVHRFARRCGAELNERDTVDEWLRYRRTAMPMPIACGRSVPDPQ